MLILNNLVCLLIIVAVHEYGHYICARRYGIRPPEFSLGFGPALISYAKNGTNFALRMIPLGGYVSIPPEEIEQLALKSRLLIYFGGPLANLALCIVVAVISALFGPMPDMLKHEPLFLRLLIAIPGTIVIFICAVPLTMVGLMHVILHPISASHEVSGPIGVISGPAASHDMMANLSPWGIALLTTYMLSLGLGSFNLVPISILDGGRIFRAIFSRFGRFIAVWDWATGLSLAALFIYLIGGDIYKLVA